MKEQQPHNLCKGFTLLIAILVIGIILAIGLSILNITLKEFILSGIARESAIALGAADAGMECALYWDRSSQGDTFDVGAAASSITCMGQPVSAGGGASGVSQDFSFTWGDPAVCAKVYVTKYYNSSGPAPMGVNAAGNAVSCPQGVECTRVVSLGYNRACNEIEDDPRAVERGLRARY